MEKELRDFILIFRMDIVTPETQPSEEQMEAYMEQWEAWIAGIVNKNQLASGGNHMSTEGRVLYPNNKITQGPYISNKESVAGYILIKAENFDDAANIAKDCPILQGEGTSVEIREV